MKEIETMRKLNEQQYHAAYDAIREPARPRGDSHRLGICGGHGDLCSRCGKIEYAWHIQVARVIGAAVVARPEETLSEYWHRAGGKFLDTWPGAAREAMAVSSR